MIKVNCSCMRNLLNYSQKVTENSPNEIVIFLKNAIVNWADGKDSDYDITFVVNKSKVSLESKSSIILK
ncbi:MAG: hypothetical protein L3J41_14660 [Melioribacteraceae bacterium]|nr:hypothetical protein [Melioribacteraceae bacterium]